MPRKTPTNRKKIVSERNIWPDGWFVSSGKKVKGPFTASEVFDEKTNILDPSDKKNEHVLVSRKGFKKWYPKDDLRQLYKGESAIDNEIEESLRKDLLAELSQIESILESVSKPEVPKQSSGVVVKKTVGMEVFSAKPGVEASDRNKTIKLKSILGASAEPGEKMRPVNQSTKVASKTVAVKTVTKSMVNSVTRDIAKKVAGSTEDLQDKKIIRDGLSTKESNTDRDGIEQRRKIAKEAAEQIKNFTPSPENALSYYHMILQGRLRLGNLDMPTSVFLKGFTSLGFSTVGFITSKFGEVEWHVDASIKTKFHLLSKMLMVFPVMNIFYITKLANKIIEMESQNKYQATSILLTVLYSFIPGLACCYLQAKMNYHWRLHAMSSLKKDAVTFPHKKN